MYSCAIEPLSIVIPNDAKAGDLPAGSPEARPKHRGGRPPEFPWDDIGYLLTRYFIINGVPATRAGTIRLIQEICRKNGIKEPSEGGLKEKIQRFFEIWLAEENELPSMFRST